MVKPRVPESPARAALAAWTLLTCVYAALSGADFIQTNFLLPRLYPSGVRVFLMLHPLLTAAALGAAAGAAPRGRKACWTAAAAATAVFITRPLTSLRPGAWCAAVALGAALPLLAWEACFAPDRARAVDWSRSPETGGAAGRLAGAALAGALCALASLSSLLPLDAWGRGALLMVACASALEHAALFAGAAAALEALRRAAAGGRRSLAALLAGQAVVAFALARWLLTLVFEKLDLRGPAVAAYGWLWPAAAAACWAGARASALRRSPEPRSAPAGARLILALGAACALMLARPALGANDYNGLLSALIAAGAWAAVFAALRPGRPAGGDKGGLALAGALVAAAWLGSTAAALADPTLRLKDEAPAALMTRAAASDASLALARRAVEHPGAGDFFQLLRANTNIPRDVALSPRRIELTEGAAAAAAFKPHVFVFVIDSLRRDYVGVYNPAVTFTPNFDAFARENLWFSNPLAAYGATGLSEPSIWAGSLLIHRQYVTPFAPMNALERLFDELGYRKLLTGDAIVSELWTKGGYEDLDPDTVGFYSLCDSLRHLEERLDKPGDGRPLFVYSQAQDVHVASITRGGGKTLGGKTYRGFYGPYASRLERVDACFGAFVASLKRRKMYDDSLIVVTADHGDALGDLGRWGHAASVFPEIMRIPLLLRLPKAWAGKARADREGPAYLIDLAPTLYRLFGRGEPRRNELLGRPLVTLDGRDPAAWRKPDQMVASSYGPAYGVITEGKTYFIADGVNFAYHLYELQRDPEGRHDLVTAGAISRGQKRLREWLAALNSFWGRN